MIKNQRIIIAGLISSKMNVEGYLNPIRIELQERGFDIVGEIIQRRGVSRSKRKGGSKKLDLPMNPKTFMGSGKVAELEEEVASKQPELVFFLNELNGNQIANIQEIINCKVELYEQEIT